jgi:protein involved in polysaccharide export with SLBB domain
VVDAKRDFRPFTTYRPQGRFRFAIEASAGAVRLGPGDRVRW